MPRQVEDAGLVGLHLGGVLGGLEQGEEVGVAVEPLQHHAVEGVAVAVVGRHPVVLLVAPDVPGEHRLLGDHPPVGAPLLVELLDRQRRVALHQHRQLDHGAIQWPQFTSRLWPVTGFDRSDAKNSTDPAISLECGRYPRAVSPATSWYTSSPLMPRFLPR